MKQRRLGVLAALAGAVAPALYLDIDSYLLQFAVRKARKAQGLLRRVARYHRWNGG